MCKQFGETVYPLGNGAEPVRPMVDRVHAGHDGGKYLRCAYVGGRFGPPDVLLPSLERHSQGGISVRVHRHPDDSSGYLALERLGGGQISGMRAAVAHGHPEPLRGPHRNIRAEVARRGQEREAE